MLNRCILPSRSPLILYPSLRPCLALVPSPHKPTRSVAAPTTHERVSMSLYRHRERAASPRARIRSARTLNEQRECFLASQPTPFSNLKPAVNLCRVPKRRRRRASLTRPSLVHPPQRSRRTRAKSPLQVHVRVQPVKAKSAVNLYRVPKRRRRRASLTRPSAVHLPQRGRRTRTKSPLRVHVREQPVKAGRQLRRSRARRGDADSVLRHLYQIAKPSRSIGPHRGIVRTQYVSFSLWPKDTSWSSHQSTTDSLENINLDWSSNFHEMKIPKEMQGWTSLRTKRVIRYYACLDLGRRTGSEKWIELRGYDAERLWWNVMLWCLKYHRRQALVLLLATLKGRKYRPPRYVISDCLAFLARHFLFEVSNPASLAIDAIWLLTCKFIDGAGNQDRDFPVSQHLVYLVLQYSEDSRVLSLYGLIGLNKAVLEVDTMLHFLDRFLDMGRINLSMKLLGTIAKTNFDLSRDQIQMACVKLLRARFDTQDEYTVRSNILTQILEMGIRPKVHMLNTILLNAGEGGDFANAWKMYGLAKENALVPHSITYGVLLKGAVLSGSSTNIEMVISEIHSNGRVLQDLRLVNDVLNAVSLISPGDEFRAMLDFYKQHCDLRPLQELLLCGDETQAPPGATGHGVWPTSYILTQMILAYVRLHEGSSSLILNYKLYHQHVKDHHPLIAPLAQNNIVANSFIMAFGKAPGTLSHCITVVKHMLEFSSPEHPKYKSVPCAVPGVQTWSILVMAYFGNRQRLAAEKVLDMMRERGIQYDSAHWNTLVSGYAGLQDMNAAVDTVKRMVVAGFEVDKYTTRGLGKLWMRDDLDKALKTSIERPFVEHRTTVGVVPSLDSEERDEVDMSDEWVSTKLNVRREMESPNAKGDEYLDTEMEKTMDGLAATVTDAH